jgi:hypothetical protein
VELEQAGSVETSNPSTRQPCGMTSIDPSGDGGDTLEAGSGAIVILRNGRREGHRVAIG